MNWGSGAGELTPLNPQAAPPWLKPLTDNCRDVKRAYRRRVPPEVLALVTAEVTVEKEVLRGAEFKSLAEIDSSSP